MIVTVGFVARPRASTRRSRRWLVEASKAAGRPKGVPQRPHPDVRLGFTDINEIEGCCDLVKEFLTSGEPFSSLVQA